MNNNNSHQSPIVLFAKITGLSVAEDESEGASMTKKSTVRRCEQSDTGFSHIRFAVSCLAMAIRVGSRQYWLVGSIGPLFESCLTCNCANWEGASPASCVIAPITPLNSFAEVKSCVPPC